MKAEIICVGTELLLGHILNTNSRFLSQKLAESGFDLYHHTTVGDNPERLMQSIKIAARRADIIILTGGLGPTVDDITMETVANLIGKELIVNKVVLKDLKSYFQLKGMNIPAGSARQAMVPRGVTVIRNRVGIAPGIIADYNGSKIVCLPGPPREMEPMFESEIAPRLQKLFRSKWIIRSRIVRTTALAESEVNKILKDLLELEPPTTVGIYSKLREVDLHIMSKARNAKAAEHAISKIEKKIRSRLKNFIFGYDSDTLEGAAGKVLADRKRTIAIAESCTGGLLSSRLTDNAGASEYLMMSVVAYSNKAKVNILGVREESIERYGAVSNIVALEMAGGIKKLAKTDVGVGITGIAGPTGGTKTKPVGLVYIALYSGARPIVKEVRLRGSRQEIKYQASQIALDMIRKNI